MIGDVFEEDEEERQQKQTKRGVGQSVYILEDDIGVSPEVLENATRCGKSQDAHKEKSDVAKPKGWSVGVEWNAPEPAR